MAAQAVMLDVALDHFRDVGFDTLADRTIPGRVRGAPGGGRAALMLAAGRVEPAAPDVFPGE